MAENDTKTSTQYIIFTLVNETMGIPIHFVREVINLNMHNLYQIPGSPSYFKGVINLRGQVIPIVDARKKLNFGTSSPPSNNPKSIIVEHEKEHFGLVVDSVEEVAYIRDDSIEPAPGPLSSSNKDRKIGRISGKDKDGKDRFVFLLSKEVLFGEFESKEALIPSQFRKVLNEVSINKTE
ncbi:MAG: chemotaxis protein CheW [Candidatus Caenarcaniphilales bacterium]|nr:chemotaxis protein CheW [Candidatus Caenarcaniphilales bacterium]